jgi:hypothetical protein
MVDARFSRGKEPVEGLGLVVNFSVFAIRKATLPPLRRTPRFILLSSRNIPMPQTSIKPVLAEILQVQVVGSPDCLHGAMASESEVPAVWSQ